MVIKSEGTWSLVKRKSLRPPHPPRHVPHENDWVISSFSFSGEFSLLHYIRYIYPYFLTYQTEFIFSLFMTDDALTVGPTPHTCLKSLFLFFILLLTVLLFTIGGTVIALNN